MHQCPASCLVIIAGYPLHLRLVQREGLLPAERCLYSNACTSFSRHKPPAQVRCKLTACVRCSTKQLAGVLGHAAALGFAQRHGDLTLQALGEACSNLGGLEARHLMKLVEAASQRQDVPKAQLQVCMRTGHHDQRTRALQAGEHELLVCWLLLATEYADASRPSLH